MDAKPKVHIRNTDITNFQSYFSMLLIVQSAFQMCNSCLSMFRKMDLLCTISLKHHYVVSYKGLHLRSADLCIESQKHLITGITGMFINYIDK